MRSKPLELHAEAERDYLNALDWYRSQSLPAAERFYNAFWQAIQTVEDAPQRWPVYLSHFRRYNLHDFPFSIVYREEACVGASRRRGDGSEDARADREAYGVEGGGLVTLAAVVVPPTSRKVRDKWGTRRDRRPRPPAPLLILEKKPCLYRIHATIDRRRKAILKGEIDREVSLRIEGVRISQC
jgi:hypothetical protein